MTYDDLSIGPIGLADRNLLVAVAGYYHQPAVLEYGSAEGHSAQAWLDGGASVVHCVDLRLCQGMAEVLQNNSERVRFFQGEQTAFVPPQGYDIAFIDASHSLGANMATLKAVECVLLPGGCVVIHDTGKWAAGAMTDAHRGFAGVVDPADGGKWHQPGEVEFVRWMQRRGWQCVSLASRTALRHGITLCQPGASVEVGE
jgi:SAM-dependent methyltransferase